MVGSAVAGQGFLQATFVHPVAFNVAGFQVYTFGMCLAAAIMIPYFVLEYLVASAKPKVRIDPLLEVLVVIPPALVGAKLMFLLTLDSWTLSLSSMGSGFSFQGGLIGGAIAVLVYCRYLDESIFRITDMHAPLLPLGHAIGKVGCFLSGDGCYGPPADPAVVPWAMSFPYGAIPVTVPVHPTPLYELVLSGSIFVYLWLRRESLVPGMLLAHMCWLMGLSRLLVERYRNHDPSVLGLSTYQAVAVSCLVCGTLLYLAARKQARDAKSKGGNDSSTPTQK